MDNSSEGDPYSSSYFLKMPFLFAQTSTTLTSPPPLPFIDNSNNNLLLLCVIGLLLVASLLRSARTAIFSLDENDHLYLAKQHAKFAKQANKYLSHDRIFALIVRWAAEILSLIAALGLYIYLSPFINNIGINQIATAALTVLAISLASFTLEFAFSNLAARKSLWFAKLMAMPLAIIYSIFAPIANIWGTHYKLSPTPPAPDHDVFNNPTSANSHPTNNTNQTETPINKSRSAFQNLSVKQVMCNRVDIHAIDIDTDFKTICRKVIEWGYSRVPVYEEDLDHIVGILYAKELLSSLENPDTFEWKNLIKAAYFIPQNKKVSDLLKEMQGKRVHLAVAVDEFGDTSGLITLEDILEEIVGDIRDESDEEYEMSFKQLNSHQYLFNGRTPISDMCRIMHINTNVFDKVRGESESLGGLLIELAGKFPDEKETINYENFSFTVQTRRSNRIDEVKVTLSQPESIA